MSHEFPLPLNPQFYYPLWPEGLSKEKLMQWKTREIRVGRVGVGGDQPIRIQSMTTSDTRDVEVSVNQTIRLSETGCEIVRLTVQGKKEAAAFKEIKNRLVQLGCDVPLVADIHFYPPAAMEVIEYADKVRINPGNFADRRASFRLLQYDDLTYQAELKRIEDKFIPLVQKAKQLGKALRIGTNHGSLSDRIMNRYGDSPAGMVESALEYARICRQLDFHNFLFSMKSSNTHVMIEAYRLLVTKMLELGWDYPLHLGVTEAGEGEDGRVKSAIGIGALLLDGIGDTIRVSLTEDPWAEIDPCRRLAALGRQPYRSFTKPEKRKVEIQEPLHRDGSVVGADLTAEEAQPYIFAPSENYVAETRAFFAERNSREPVILKFRYDLPEEEVVIRAAADYGALLCDGLGEGIFLDAPQLTDERGVALSFNILQGARMRQTKTEFISCPGCGRTLFDLQEVSARIRSRTDHLVGVKIAIMGCIVNGPGEMADADFGYVGSRPGKIDLYVGKECVEKNINMEDADDRLIELIKAHNRWEDAPNENATATAGKE